jgi:hypothetical protein
MKISKSIMFTWIIIMVSGALFAQDITGTWSGTLTIPQGTLRVNFNISEADKGYTSTLDSPDQNAFGIPTDTTIYKKPELKITIAQLGAEYTGKLSEGNKFEGTFTQMGQVLKLDLTKKQSE